MAESRFRRLKAPELMKDVYLGAFYKDGIIVEPTPEKGCRLIAFTHTLT